MLFIESVVFLFLGGVQDNSSLGNIAKLIKYCAAGKVSWKKK